MKCHTCGATHDKEEPCPRCRGKICPICEQPLFRDESVAKTAMGYRHVRCGLHPTPRPAWMKSVAV